MTKQIHLAAHFPGVNNTTVWSDPAAGSHIEFDSFRKFTQTAERGKFDFMFLAEGLRLREQNGAIYDLDVVGRPDTFTVLAALAAVTEHIGLTGTINSTFNEPYEVARQFASLDHLSGGRAAWNVVTSWDAFTGENFRRGGYLAQADRYERARTFLATAIELWDSWHGDEILADKDTGQFLGSPAPGAFRHQDGFFDIAGHFNVLRSPQGRPVIFQAGDSDEGRDFAAASADAIFSRHSTLEAGQAFYADVKGRLPKFGRVRQPGRRVERGLSRGVAGGVVVLPGGGHDLHGGQRARPVTQIDHADGNLGTVDETLDQRRVAVGEAAHDRGGKLGCGPYRAGAERGAAARGLTKSGRPSFAMTRSMTAVAPRSWKISRGSVTDAGVSRPAAATSALAVGCRTPRGTRWRRTRRTASRPGPGSPGWRHPRRSCRGWWETPPSADRPAGPG